MDLIHFLIDFILHIDVHLAELVAQYGVWVYAILFLILFCETGLVVTPFLPGVIEIIRHKRAAAKQAK
ncbi:hypothetical protein MBS40_001036 [Klebsiella pneumoniae]|nr:hypothetical protein [Klebsiella pneumoniae]EKX1587448.1 hypothetical protein [Klebsiella pneumoniae]